MNIHVAHTHPARKAFMRTCFQGQTSGLTVRPDAERCNGIALYLEQKIKLMV